MEPLQTRSDFKDLVRFIAAASTSRLHLNRRYGKLFASRESKKGYNSDRKYLCQCDCGNLVYLSSFEIRIRGLTWEGCASEDCDRTSVLAKRWFNPEYSMRLQWGHWLYREPDTVQRAWGGYVKGHELEDEQQGFKRFYRHVKKQIDISNAKLWVHKQSKALPFMEGNIVVTRKYLPSVFSAPWKYISDGTEFRTYQNVADMLGTNVQHVLQVRTQHKFSFDAYKALMGLDGL